jgi:hypothetical protein
MNWKNSKVASYLAFFYSIAVFIFGLWLGGFNFNNLVTVFKPTTSLISHSTPNSPLLNVLLSSLFSGGVMFVFIEAVIKAEAEKESRLKLGEFHVKLSDLVDSILKELDSLDIPPVERGKHRKKLERIKKENIEVYINKKTASLELVEWLDQKLEGFPNGSLLADRASYKAIMKYRIPEGKDQDSFKDNIRCCMCWLPDSLEAFAACDLSMEDLELLASAIPHLTDGVKPYEYALDAIQLKLESKSSQTGVAKDLIDDLKLTLKSYLPTKN